MSDGTLVPGSFYFYAPNKGAPIFFAVAFAVSGILHLWQCFRYKCFKLMALFPFCCLVFTAGFALREYGAFHYDHLRVYLISTVLIYTPSPLLQLANYHILARTFHYVPYNAPMHPSRVLANFGTLSLLVELLNGIGIAWVANRSLTSELLKLGGVLLKVSLVLQFLVVALFYAVAGVFHRRCYLRGGILSSPSSSSPPTEKETKKKQLSGVLYTLYASMFLILVRTAYRTAEHFGTTLPTTATTTTPEQQLDNLSPLITKEPYFYAFEASLMLLSIAIFNVWHPRRYLPAKKSVYLALHPRVIPPDEEEGGGGGGDRDGGDKRKKKKKEIIRRDEIEGPGWKDERFWDISCFDPCGTVDTSGRDGRAFWEEVVPPPRVGNPRVGNGNGNGRGV